MIEGLTAVYGVNTQATFQFANYADANNFTRAVTGVGCFAHSAGAYKVIVLGSLEKVELVARAYPKVLVKQPSPELVG